MALSLGFYFLLLNGAEGQEQITFSDGKKCDLDGTAKSEAGKTLNRLKNRFHIPQAADIDHDVTLAAMLARGEAGNRVRTY